jgi:hypothetical protein
MTMTSTSDRLLAVSGLNAAPEPTYIAIARRCIAM